MYHVLEVETANFNIGGTEQFIVKNIQHIDRNKFSMGFLCCGLIKDQKGFDSFQNSFDSAEALNINYGILKPWKIFTQLRKHLKNHPCDIIHIHNGFVANLAVCAVAAKLAGVRHIICHLHGTDLAKDSNKLKSIIKTMRKRFNIHLLGSCATDFFTCSKKAAELTFGENFLKKHSVLFFPNAIDVNSFLFNPAERNEIRRQYHLTNQFVIGTVGRLSQEKNQLFLLDIFCKILEKRDDAVMMLVGDGPSKSNIQDRIRQLHLEDKVILTGAVSNVDAYLQAFDVFVLPSFTEAYPIVMVESQAAGLPTFVSDVITKETAITDLVQFVSLNEPAQVWCDAILSDPEQLSPNSRRKEFTQDAFDIQKNGKNLENHYLTILDNRKPLYN